MGAVPDKRAQLFFYALSGVSSFRYSISPERWYYL